MQRFFASLRDMDYFSRSLDCLSKHPCSHCQRNDQWVSHGYVYKQSGEKVGKRILCGKRYGKRGCGHTRQLYLQHIIPQRRYTLSQLLAFVCALIRGLTVERAYVEAVGHTHSSHRQSWRWLSALWARMSCFRNEVPGSSRSDWSSLRCRSRRLSILLSTLKHWLIQVPDKRSVQCCWQRRFC